MEARKGSQTPSHAVILPYTSSEGDEACRIYEMTGRTAQEWQRLLLTNILGKNDEGLWTHTKFGYAVPRRNGKNEVVAMRELYGLREGEKILHTAHRTTTSRSAWERLCQLLDDAGIEYKATGALGQESIRLPCRDRTADMPRDDRKNADKGYIPLSAFFIAVNLRRTGF